MWLDVVLYSQIRRIMATQGPLPNNMLSHGRKTACFFQREHKSGTTSWKLKVLYFQCNSNVLLPQTPVMFKCYSFFLTFQTVTGRKILFYCTFIDNNNIFCSGTSTQRRTEGKKNAKPQLSGWTCDGSFSFWSLTVI